MYPIFYAGSVGSRHGGRPLPTSVKMQFISFVAGFAFISREYISEYLPMTAPVTLKKKIFLTTIMYMTTRDAFPAAKIHIE